MEKQLLFADKRIAAGLELIEKDKPSLAVQTALKGEYYLLSATQDWSTLTVEERSRLEGKLSRAALKHQQVLTYLGKSIDGGSEEVSRALEVNLQATRTLRQK